MASEVAQCKAALKDVLLRKCNHGFYEWCDPQVSETRLCHHSWCKAHQVDSALALATLHAIVTTPTDDYLDSGSLVLLGSFAPKWYQVRDHLMMCMSTQDLISNFVNQVDHPTARNLCNACCAIATIANRGESAINLLPPTMFDVPLANSVALLGVPLPVLEKIVGHGHQLQFPVVPTEDWNRVYTLGYKAVCFDVATFLVNHSNRIYPVGISISEMSGNIYKYRDLVYPVAYSDRFFVSKPAFLRLVGYGSTFFDELDAHLFLSWLRTSIKRYDVDNDDVEDITCYWRTTFPKFEPVKVLLENLTSSGVEKEVVDSVILSATRNDTWNSAVEQFLLYFFATNVLPSHTRSYWEEYEFCDADGSTSCIDPRVINYICQESQVTARRPNSLGSTPPNFTTSPDLHIQFSDQVRVTVYSEFITKRSPVISVLVDGHGFKQVLTSSGPEKVLVLQTGLPEQVCSHEGAVNAWVTFCYTASVKPSLSVEDIVDLKILADYLQDDTCVATCNLWLEYEYMSKEEHYAGSSRHVRECAYCTHWKTTCL